MTVINPNSISGITSITMPSGDGNVLTVHTNDGVERFRIDSSGNVKVGSAATISPDGDLFVTGVTTTGGHFAGSGANLTNLPAANLTGALPAISGANLTGIAATDNVRTGILEVAGIATFSSDVKIGAAVTISESGIEASGIGITCANINGTQIGGRRNVVINGGMKIYQRGSQSFAHDGTQSGYNLDRFTFNISATDEYDCTITQDSSVPDGQGFSKSLKVTTGTAESAVGADERYEMQCKLEGQDLQHFVYGSSAAKTITLSFWVRCSVAGTYGFSIYRAESAGSRIINRPYTISSANTWEKKVITIAGDTVRSIVNDSSTASAWRMVWALSGGSNWTSDSTSTWGAYGTTYYLGGHVTNTFATTASSTWYMTGVQLEVGSQATAFEHRSAAEEERLCQRYYFRQTADHQYMRYACHGQTPSANGAQYVYQLPVRMRAAPTLGYSALSDFYLYAGNLQGKTPTSIAMDASSTISPMFSGAKSSTFTGGQAAHLTAPNSVQGYLEFIAEL